MNFARDVLDRQAPGDLALLELARDGKRREWTFAEIAEQSARLAGALQARGVRTGDVVMTLIGNRPEWVASMCACFRIGAVVLPCTEQLRAKDLRLRLAVARPSLLIADERNRSELEAAAPECEVAFIGDEALFAAEPAPAVELGEEDPCLITFTSGTSGEPKAVVHGQRYLAGQRAAGQPLAGCSRGRARVVHRRLGLEQVGAERVHRAMAVGRSSAVARRALRSFRAPGRAAQRAGEHPLHGSHRVPRDRQARDDSGDARPARDGGGRRGAQPRGAARLEGGDGTRDPRRLRADRDRPADRHCH